MNVLTLLNFQEHCWEVKRFFSLLTLLLDTLYDFFFGSCLLTQTMFVRCSFITLFSDGSSSVVYSFLPPFIFRLRIQDINQSPITVLFGHTLYLALQILYVNIL